MGEVESFYSVEEMFRTLAKAEAEANERVRPFQEAIGQGDHWVRVWVAYGEALLIFGRVDTDAEHEARLRGYGDVDEEEIEHERDQIFRESWNRGYRHGECYSVVEPTGEWGSTHISEMVPITQEMFDDGRLCLWSPCLLDETTSWFAKLRTLLSSEVEAMLMRSA